jgi:phosphoglycolate phosphatase
MARHIVFFDIDGTMLSTGGAGQKAMEQALVEEFRIDFPFENVLTAGRTDCGIADEIFSKYSLKDTREERARFMQSYLRRLPGCLQSLPGSLLPGVQSLLEHLTGEADVHLSLLTGNYLEGAWIKLRHFQIDHYFTSGGYGDAHAERDDVARQALINVRAHLNRNLDQSHISVVGDTPADIRCARAIGAQAVAVATGMYSADDLRPFAPDFLFEDLSGTRSVAEKLLRRNP